MNATMLDTDRLAEVLRRKLECLLQLHELGQQQIALADGGDVNDLLRVLGAKQLLINQLHQLQRELEPYRDQDPERRVWRSDDDRRRCAQCNVQSEALFAEVLEQERRAEQVLQRRRDESLEQLREAYAGEHVRRAYTPDLPYGQSTFDLTSEV